MKQEWKLGLWMLAVLCWAPAANAETAASSVAAASAVAATPEKKEKKVFTADEYYTMGQATMAQGEIMESIWMFKSAADLGHEKAMIEVANLYESALRMKDAFIYYSMAANLGNTTAMVNLAQILESAQETEGMAKDPLEARKLMTLAAEKGNHAAIVYLAAGYVRGGFGLTKEERNSPEGLEWVKRAAAIDDVFATQVLAKAYRVGLFGLTIDTAEADKWDAKLVELQNRGKKKEEVKKTSKKRR